MPIEYLKEYQYEKVVKKKNLDEFDPDEMDIKPELCDHCEFTHYIQKKVCYDSQHKYWKVKNYKNTNLTVSLITKEIKNIKLIEIEFKKVDGNQFNVAYTIKMLQLLKHLLVSGDKTFILIPCLHKLCIDDLNVEVHVYYKIPNNNMNGDCVEVQYRDSVYNTPNSIESYEFVDIAGRGTLHLSGSYYIPDNFSKQYTVRNGKMKDRNRLVRTGTKPIVIIPKQKCWSFFEKDPPIQNILEIKTKKF